MQEQKHWIEQRGILCTDNNQKYVTVFNLEATKYIEQKLEIEEFNFLKIDTILGNVNCLP